MGGWLISAAGLVGFAALCLWFVPRNARSIERDVLHRTTKALNDGHIAVPRDGVRISGRDITLSAAQGEALVSDATRELVMTIEGVRSVQLKTTPDR